MNDARASRQTFASLPSTCPGTASPRRRPAAGHRIPAHLARLVHDPRSPPRLTWRSRSSWAARSAGASCCISRANIPNVSRALIGLESAAHTEPYYDLSWLNRPDVHGGMVCAGVVSGLIAPTAPMAERWETLWHYMQSGPGVFKGDLHFYTVDGDIRDRVDGSTSSAVRCFCSPANTIIPAPAKPPSTLPSAPALPPS